MREALVLSFALSVGVTTLFGCNDTAVVLRVVSNQHLDAMCVGLDAGGQHRFGKRYDLTGLMLPQTLSVLAGGQGAFQETIYGYRRGLDAAHVERQVTFKSQSVQHLDVPLDSCVPSPATSSGTFTPAATAPGMFQQAVLLSAPSGRLVVADGALFSAGALAPIPKGHDIPAGATSALVTADLDGDCQQDLVWMPQSALFTRASDGGFVDQMGALGGVSGSASASADVNSDGFPDLVIVGGNAAHVLLGDGVGHFHELPSAFDVQPTDATALAVGDLDGDGNVDVVVGQGSAMPATTRVYLNDAKGSGHFGFVAAALPPRLDRTTALALADVDGDGDLDLVTAHVSAPVRLYVNRGNAYLDDRSFGGLPDQVAATVPSLLLTDLNADCLPDLVVPRAGGASLLWINGGGDSFVDGAPLMAPESLGALAADVNGDGLVDLILWGANGLVQLVQQR